MNQISVSPPPTVWKHSVPRDSNDYRNQPKIKASLEKLLLPYGTTVKITVKVISPGYRVFKNNAELVPSISKLGSVTAGMSEILSI